MAQTGATYRQQVHSAQAGASGIQAAVAAALPQLQAIYGSNPVAGIPGLSRAQALNDMTTRGVQAAESVAATRRTAGQQLAADRAKILSRRADIGQEIGAFTTSEVGKLGQQAADRQLRNRLSLRSTGQSERNSLRSAGINPDTGNPIPGGKLDPNRPGGPRRRKPATPAARQAATDHIGTALGALQTLDPDRNRSDRPHVASLLMTGRKARPLYTVDPTTKKRTQRLSPIGEPIMTPQIPRVPQPFTTAALDQYYDGHVSRKAQERLQRLGYSVRDLGLTSFGDYQRAHPAYSRPGRRVY